jgi:threonine/homoserine/homoserine lactone efflux protein
MREIQYLIKGFIIGLSIAVPVGPIGILCIRRTLARGRVVGFLSGLGAATADAFYGAVAGFGLTFLSDFLIGQHSWLRLIGGVVLCYLGIRTFLSRPPEQGASLEEDGLWSAFLSTLFITLTNPLTILFFVAVFAGLGVVSTGDHYVSAGILVAGVFIGSAMWWLVLCGFTGLLQKLLNPKRLRWLNRISGLTILGFGLFALIGIL